MHVTASDGSNLNRDVALNMDVHDASAGVEDDWIFYGDSITAAAMAQTHRGAGTFAQQIDAMTKHFPIQENGGIPSLTSRDGVNHIRQWLGLFPGTYVALSYGTNDAGWGIPPQDFYNNYVGMVRAVLQAGKIPVIPTIPWGRTANIQKNGPGLNAKIDELYRTFPQVIRGPDLWAYFAQHPSLISSDGIHPTDEGFAAYRRQWVEDVVSKIY